MKKFFDFALQKARTTVESDDNEPNFIELEKKLCIYRKPLTYEDDPQSFFIFEGFLADSSHQRIINDSGRFEDKEKFLDNIPEPFSDCPENEIEYKDLQI